MYIILTYTLAYNLHTFCLGNNLRDLLHSVRCSVFGVVPLPIGLLLKRQVFYRLIFPTAYAIPLDVNYV